MLELPGYDLVERLFENARTVAYRGVRRADGVRVVVKASSLDYPSAAVLAALRNEHEIGGLVDAPGVPRMLGLERCRNGLALIMEDIGATSLHTILRRGPLGVAAFLPVALELSRALDALHARRILHKDVKPENVVIHGGTGRVQIIDFGLASRLSQEIEEAQSPGVLEGTLLYMAPEQTGRMNRPVDSRSDVYSLGATCYEMLTGVPPFSAADPIELVHCHLARTARSPREVAPEIPAVVSRIVMKMLEKRAEDRYQSCRGLAADLEECLRRLAATGTLDDFELGRSDIPDRFRVLDRLYGREADLEAVGRIFTASFAGGSGGRTRIVLVSGAPGVGKSSILRELTRPLVSRRGYFVTGKFDQLQRNVPYSGVASALADLFRQILSESDDRLATWRARLLEALGPNGRLLVEMAPVLEVIVGPQPAVSELPPAETRNRFEALLRAVFGALAAPARPLVILLDDLQWADGASLRLVEILGRDPSLQDLLLVGAYRDSEVDAAHPLSRAASALENDGCPVQRLHLDPLSLADVGRLVADAVCRDDEASAALARVVFDKTRGVPFFVRELLGTLAQEGKVRFDRDGGRWTWDLAEIEALGLSSNVVELMTRRLRGLGPTERRVLSLAAAVGHTFELAQIEAVAELSPLDAARALAPAVHLGLLVPLGAAQQLIGWIEGATALAEAPSSARFRFPHDRVQQAAYAEIPEAERPRVHLGIGRLLRSRAGEPGREAQLFAVVDHLDKGEALVVDPEERRALAADNLEAARRARAATAYGAAVAYLEVGRRCLPADAWASRYADVFATELLRAECEYLSGDFAAAERRFRELLGRARVRADRARVHRLAIAYHLSQGRTREAVDIGVAAARLYGVRLHAHPSRLQVLPDLARLRFTLRARDTSVIDALGLVTDPSMRELLGLLSEVTAAAFFVDKNLWAMLVLKAANLTLAHGVSPDSGGPFGALAALFADLFGDRPFAHALGAAALRLVERFNLTAVRPRVLFVMGAFLTHGLHHARENEPYLRDAYRCALEVGDLVYAGFAVGHLTYALAFKGDSLDKLAAECAWSGLFSRQIGFEEGVLQTEVVERLIRCLRGETPGPAVFGASDADERDLVRQLERSSLKFALHFYTLLKLRCLLVCGDVEGALPVADRSEALLGLSRGLLQVPEHRFLAALTLLGAARAHPREAASLVRRARVHLGHLEAFARDCPENFSHKHALVAAELAAHEGDLKAAMALYARAASAADEQDHVHDAALACDLAARFYGDLGLPDLARYHLREASQHYTRWGATGRSPARPAGSPGPGFTASGSGTVSGSAALDLVSVLKASQAISGEVALDRLLSKLIHILVENVGAERAVLMLRHKDELRIEAEAAVGRTAALATTPLLGSGRVPESIAQYVARTSTPVVLEDAQRPNPFSSDPYLERCSPRSILCAPVLDQGRLVGVLYFENNLAAGAFTAERLQVLAILSAQAAISIENARLYTAYGRFVPHELLTQLGQRSMVDVALGDQVAREMTVLFSDIRSFTDLAEKMTPEECFRFVNAYLGRAGPVIRQHGGFIDKYIGDAIMALFPAGADAAVRAAGGLLHELEAFNRDRAAAGLAPIAIGVGLNTGRVMLGTVGEAGRMDGTVIGDAVNLASRIEGLTKHYGTSVLIADETFSRLTDRDVLARPVGRVQVKGKDAPVILHEVFAADPPAVRDAKRATMPLFADGLALYAAGAFAPAAERFRACAPEDRPAALYAERCERLLHSGAPQGWSGVTRFEEK